MQRSWRKPGIRSALGGWRKHKDSISLSPFETQGQSLKMLALATAQAELN